MKVYILISARKLWFASTMKTTQNEIFASFLKIMISFCQNQTVLMKHLNINKTGS